ncbi:MAG: hypothetical protein ACQKBU_06005, partial [Verrucomicrobiales bacterium]
MKRKYRHTEFDEFLSAFVGEPENSELYYRADGFFNELIDQSNRPEKRFRYGVGGWLLWLAQRYVRFRLFAKGKDRRRECSADQPYAFRLLMTPAHQSSLRPILDRELAEEDCTLYGCGIEGGGESRGGDVEQGLFQSLPVTTVKEFWSALARTLKYLGSLRDGVARLAAAGYAAPHEQFMPRAAELIFREELEFSLLAREICRHRVLFVTYELIPETKALVRWVRGAGGRVVHVMHGQRLPMNQITRATDRVVFSILVLPWFEERM